MENVSDEQLLVELKQKIQCIAENLLEPPRDTVAQIYEYSARKIHLFRDPEIHDLLVSFLHTSEHAALFKSNKLSSTSQRFQDTDGQIENVPVIAGKLLWTMYENHSPWPLSLYRGYLNDALECRVWVDCKHQKVVDFCSNILAWMKASDVKFSNDEGLISSPGDSENVEEEEIEEEVILAENSIDITAPSTGVSVAEGLYSSTRDRFSSQVRHQEALTFTLQSVNEKISGKTGGGGLGPVIISLKVLSALPCVRLLAAQNIPVWQKNPALVEHLGRLIFQLINEVQTSPTVIDGRERTPSRSMLLSTDVQVITLLCHLRPSLKQSLLEIHRKALTSLMKRKEFSEASSDQVQRLLIRLHLEESCQSSLPGNSDCIKMLSNLLFSIAEVPCEKFACLCHGAASNQSEVIDEAQACSKFIKPGEYCFSQCHRRRASYVLGSSLKDIIFPAFSDNHSLVSNMNKAQLSTIVDDVLKIVRAIELPSFCPHMFWHAFLTASKLEPSVGGNEPPSGTNDNFLSVVSELGSSFQLLYAHSIMCFQKQRDKRLGAGQQTPKSSINDSSVGHGKHVKPGRVLQPSLGGRGGRGTAGLTLSSKNKSRTQGRGGGISLTAARQANSSKNSLDNQSVAKHLATGSRAASRESLPARSPDEGIDPGLLCEFQTNAFLRRGVLVREILMQWFVEFVSDTPNEVVKARVTDDDMNKDCSNSLADVDCAQATKGRKDDAMNLRILSSHGRPRSSSSGDDKIDKQGPTIPVMINFVQKIFAFNPTELRISAHVDAQDIDFCRDTFLLTSGLLTSLAKSISGIVALEQLLFTYHSAKHFGKRFCSIHTTKICDSMQCGLSFLEPLSRNQSAFSAISFAENEKNFTRSSMNVYNCSPLIISGLNLLELTIRKALQTSCLHETCHKAKGKSTGILINSADFVPQLFALCKLPIYDLELMDSSERVFRKGEIDTVKAQQALLRSDQVCSSQHESDFVDVKSIVGYRPIYWKVCLICYVLSCASPQTVGSYIWENETTVRMLMLMSITERFHFPPSFPLQESLAAQLRLQREQEETERRKKEQLATGKRGYGQHSKKLPEENTSIFEQQSSNEELVVLSIGSLNLLERTPDVSATDLAVLFDSKMTAQRIRAFTCIESGMLTAHDLLRFSHRIQEEEKRLWDILFCPQVLLADAYELQQKKLQNDDTEEDEDQNTSLKRKDCDTSFENDVEISDATVPAKRARLTTDGPQPVSSHNLQENLILQDDESIITEQSYVPRRSERRRVQRFNVLDVMQQGTLMDEWLGDAYDSCGYSNDSGDEFPRVRANRNSRRRGHSGTVKSTSKLSSANVAEQTSPKYSQHSTLWGVPSATELILLPLQGIPREPPHLSFAPQHVEESISESNNGANLLQEAKHWHEKFNFGKILRNSTSPDFIAAVVTGKSGETNRDNLSESKSSTRSRQYIMEAIGWLVPAITTVSNIGDGDNKACQDVDATELTKTYTVLQRIPPIATAHLLLVIALKMLQELEGRVKLRQLESLSTASHCYDGKGQGFWREAELANLILSRGVLSQHNHNQINLTEQRDTVCRILSEGSTRLNLDGVVEVDAKILLLEFLKSKTFVEDSTLFCQLLDKINNELHEHKTVTCSATTWNLSQEKRDGLLSFLVSQSNTETDHLPQNRGLSNCDTFGSILGGLIVELWHSERCRRVVGRIVLSGLHQIAFSPPKMGILTNSYCALVSFLGNDVINGEESSKWELFSLVVCNILDVETDKVAVCQILTMSKKLGGDVYSSGCSALLKAMVRCADRLELFRLHGETQLFGEFREVLRSICDAALQGQEFGSVIRVIEKMDDLPDNNVDDFNFMILTPLSTLSLDHPSDFRLCVHASVVLAAGVVLADFLQEALLSGILSEVNGVEYSSILLNCFEKDSNLLMPDLLRLFTICMASSSTLENSCLFHFLEPLCGAWGRFCDMSKEFSDAVVQLFPLQFLVSCLRHHLKQSGQIYPTGFSLGFIVAILQNLEKSVEWNKKGTDLREYDFLGGLIQNIIEMQDELSGESFPVEFSSVKSSCPTLCDAFSSYFRPSPTMHDFTVQKQNDIPVEEVCNGPVSNMGSKFCRILLAHLPESRLNFAEHNLLPAVAKLINFISNYSTGGEFRWIECAQDVCVHLWDEFVAEFHLTEEDINAALGNIVLPVLFVKHLENSEKSENVVVTEANDVIFFCVDMINSRCPVACLSPTDRLAHALSSFFAATTKLDMTVDDRNGAFWPSLQHLILDLYSHLMLDILKTTSASLSHRIAQYNQLVLRLHVLFNNVSTTKMMSIEPEEYRKILVFGDIVSFSVWIHLATLFVSGGYEWLILQNDRICRHHQSISLKDEIACENINCQGMNSLVGFLLALIGRLESYGIILGIESFGISLVSVAPCADEAKCKNCKKKAVSYHADVSKVIPCQSCCCRALLGTLWERWCRRRTPLLNYNRSFPAIGEFLFCHNLEGTNGKACRAVTKFLDLLWPVISTDDGVAMDILQQCIGYALDLQGARRKKSRTHSTVEDTGSKSRRGRKGKRKVKRKATNREQEVQNVGSIEVSIGRSLIRTAIYYAYLSFPTITLSCLTKWVNDQLQSVDFPNLPSEISQGCGSIPVAWIENAIKRLDPITAAKLKRRKRDSSSNEMNSNARRSSRIKRGFDNEVEIHACEEKQSISHGEYFDKEVVEVESVSVADILTNDIKVLFQMLIVTEQKRGVDVSCQGFGFETHSTVSAKTCKFSHVQFRRRCGLDEAVKSALNMVQGSAASSELSENMQTPHDPSSITSLNLTQHRANSFLLTFAMDHPSLWLMRYRFLVEDALSSLSSLDELSREQCRLRFNTIAPVIKCLCKAYEGSLECHPLIVFLSSLNIPNSESNIESGKLTYESSLENFSVCDPVNLFGRTAQFLLQGDEGESDNSREVYDDEMKGILVNALSLWQEKFTQDALLRSITKQKHYLSLTKALTPLGKELTGLVEF